MKSASVLCVFGLLLTACASTGGHRLIREEEYYAGMPRYNTTYQYEEGKLVGKTTVYFFKDFNWDDHIDTIFYSYQTNKVGDNIEEITYTTEIRKDTVIKYKSVLSGGSYSEYAYVDDEWVKECRYCNDDTSSFTFDSVTYSSDSLQVTYFHIYRKADAPDSILFKVVYRYDDKGRKISQEHFDPDETDYEYHTLFKNTYQYTRRSEKVTQQVMKYGNGEYTEEPRYKYKIVYNRSGLEKKRVEYDGKYGRLARTSRVIWKYDRKTGDPLKRTRYSITGYGVAWFRKPLYETIWTYAK